MSGMLSMGDESRLKFLIYGGIYSALRVRAGWS